jgi:oligo-1,6-glucosidase
MTINRDYVDWNVASQINDPNSVLAYRRKMLALRKEHSDLLTYGSYTPLSEGDTGEKVLGYERQCHETGKTAVVLLNFSDREQKVQIKSSAQREFEVLVSN